MPVDLKRLAFAVLARGYELIERVVPTSDALCFTSFPDVEDNALAVFAAARADQRLRGRRLVWLVRDVAAARARLAARFGPEEAAACPVVRKNSLAGLWQFLRAGRVFFTHGHYRFVRSSRSGRKLINLWHGMPLKAIGLLDETGSDTLQAADAAIATSGFFQPLMASAFGLPVENVAVTGLPRCDRLFAPSEAARAFRQRMLGDDRRLLFWMPTYRISAVGDLRQDCASSREACLAQFVHDLQVLSRLAGEKRLRVVVKIHPMDFVNAEQLPELPRLALLRAGEGVLRELDVYDLLSVADGLITDVSSVCFDFMVTRKPVLITKHLVSDYTRKLVFDKERLFDAVYTCASMDGAGEFLDAVGDERRLPEAPLAPFCQHVDDRASARVLDRFVLVGA